MFLIFKLGRPDVMPAGDLGVQEGLRILDGLDKRPKPEYSSWPGRRRGGPTPKRRRMVPLAPHGQAMIDAVKR